MRNISSSYYHGTATIFKKASIPILHLAGMAIKKPHFHHPQNVLIGL
jgi:hypothetical protein